MNSITPTKSTTLIGEHDVEAIRAAQVADQRTIVAVKDRPLLQELARIKIDHKYAAMRAGRTSSRILDAAPHLAWQRPSFV